MKIIELTKGAVAIVDDEDFEELNQYNWYLHSEGYAIRETQCNYKKTRIRMHRQILNTPEGMDTDHINGNRLDNRRENLRVCTRSQNLMNKAVRVNSETGYKGVHLHKPTGRYNAYIDVGKKRRSLGYYKTAIEAAQAYNDAIVEVQGEFARLNNI